MSESKLATFLLLALAFPGIISAATLTVTSTADAGGTCPGADCTLRQAIVTAAPDDTIDFLLPARSAITLTGGELSVNKNLKITGPGADQLSVRRSAAAATPPFRIFNVGLSVVTISGLTITNGDRNVVGGKGGGIFNLGTLVLLDVVIMNNTAGVGGGIYNDAGTVNASNCTISGNAAGIGGGIRSGPGGTLFLFSCTFIDNTATAGGGIENEGSSVFVSGSTFSGNVAAAEGGGISSSVSNGPVFITASTFSGNAGAAGGAISNVATSVDIYSSTFSGNTAANGPGGGIYNRLSGTVSATNTIIALNTATAAGPDVSGTLNSQGFNLIGNNSGATIVAKIGDQIGTPAAPIDPLLGPLQDNGGSVKTLALLTGSRAIDKGDNSLGFSTDQRGFTRTIDSPLIANASDGTDIGAFEVQPGQLAGCSEVNLVVNNNSDSGAGSLRSVIANACVGSMITFASAVRGAISLTGGELLINKNLTIKGPGANLLSVERSRAPSTAAFRIFNVAGTFQAAISGLTIANGAGSSGGGISNTATLDLNSVSISGNSGVAGGGVFNDFGTLTISNSTISGNTVSNSLIAGSGGGIFNKGGTLLVANSTVSGNTAIGPGGNSDSGGGIVTNVGKVSLRSSTITGNSADFGGGIRNLNGGVVTSSNTIIALNTSANGPDVNGPLISFGFNLIGSGLGAIITPSTLPDQIGVSAAELNLGPLQDNGGLTKTHALLAGSRAIDKGSSSGYKTDQRGLVRPSNTPSIPNAVNGDGADIGAFEVQFIDTVARATVVEFYNALLDHYFITWLAAEIAILDTGTQIKGWGRTGYSFKTYATPQSGTSPVCRYYIPPGLGDSHFFGRGTVECNATGQKNPSFVLEDPNFMQMFLPSAGTCPVDTMPIYRVFDNRPDANHRYMTDRTVRTAMVAKGWLAEGDGPDLVVMCAPQ